MARTAAPPKEVKTAKEAKVKAPVVLDEGVIIPTVPETQETEQYIWQKLSGKYHTKDRKVIAPGQTFIAGKETFTNDPAWKYIGPVE